MMNEEVLKKIHEAKASGATKLYLGGMRITTLPPEIFQLLNLTVLDLRHNQFSSLPPEICKLTNLTELNLWNNRLSDQYSAICQLPNLTVLDLRNNQFSSLPPEICKLKDLTKLNLYGNYISSLPREIDQLTKLTWLNLGHNHFNRLPSEIGKLTKLTKLDLRHSQFSSLPPEICKLTKLKELNLSNNEFNTLPLEICQLTNLQLLFLLDNQLTTLPPEICKLTKLTVLNLSNNRLSSLPPEICKLRKLEELYFGRNPLTSPPYEIATRGINAICQYFSALEPDPSIGVVSNPHLLPPKNQALNEEFNQQEDIQLLPCDFSGTSTVETEDQPLNEVKVLLIGDGASGKTSLTKRLISNEFNPQEPVTHGILITPWQIESGDRQIKANIWDFGGQDMMHATHQFFLSKRSLYIILLDGRKDERAEYWLRHVSAFGGDSPVLIVLNKQDENCGFDLNRTHLQRKYPAVRGFYSTSCKHGEGIDDLKETLIEELGKVPMSDTLLPTSWFQVKGRLEQMSEQYISCDKYEKICTDAGIVEQNEQDVLLDLLHDLGVAMHFKDLELYDTHVLNPLWLTNGVYRIINTPEATRQRGILVTNSLRDILCQQSGDKHCYPRSRHRYLIALMRKFELCYKLDSQRVLIPQLLPVMEPDFHFDESASSLRFIFHYLHFLPPSIFPRFMVKMHKNIKADLRWRTGVVLENKEFGAEALVKVDNETRKISILVNGRQRKDYFAVLLLFFREINTSFEHLKVNKLVPMPDAPEITARYSTLLKLEEKGMDDYLPDDSDKVYSVAELLGLVQFNEQADVLEKILRTLEGMQEKQFEDKKSLIKRVNKVVGLKPNLFGIGLDINALLD